MPVHSHITETGQKSYSASAQFSTEFYEHIQKADAASSDFEKFLYYKAAASLANSIALEIPAIDWFTANDGARIYAIKCNETNKSKKFTLISASLGNLLEPRHLAYAPQTRQLKNLTHRAVWDKIDALAEGASCIRLVDYGYMDTIEIGNDNDRSFPAHRQFILNYDAIQLSEKDPNYYEYYIGNSIHLLQKYGTEETNVDYARLSDLCSRMWSLSDTPFETKKAWHQTLLSFAGNSPAVLTQMRELYQSAENEEKSVHNSKNIRIQ
jgi:hypothetical protein